jgi:hypothetical protein
MSQRVMWLCIFLLLSTGCATSDRVSCGGLLEPINQSAVPDQRKGSTAHDGTESAP